MNDSSRRPGLPLVVLLLSALSLAAPAGASYTNFESSHVHPIDRTPDGTLLLALNTPDALLELFTIEADGSLTQLPPVPVGLEPVTVVARNDGEAWVVNNLSDSISIVDLATRTVTRTLSVGDEPVDVVFAAGRAFVAVSQLDEVEVFDLADLDAPPTTVPLFGRDVRALATDGSTVWAVVLRSGNRTSVVNANIIFGNSANLNATRLAALNLRDMTCSSAPPPYPPLPSGIQRNPALTDPPASTDPALFPKVALIVRWDDSPGRWLDEAGSDWSDCLPFKPADRDLFAINANSLAVTTEVTGLGTSLFDISLHPDGRLYVPNTDARNFVRFEHPLGIQGHVVDNRLSIVDPGSGYGVTIVDLNSHIDRGSDPATNLAERQASISQPGMLVWNGDGSQGYLTAIGSRKVFRVDGACNAPDCIFGSGGRASPDAVEVGEGPTGVVLDEAHDRLYVLNRISHSLALVQASTLTLLDEIPLHDPSSVSTRGGRRFLYDAIDGSGHGDAACSSCHVFGDRDGEVWDLGDPTGTMVPYTTPLDNVRFVSPQGGAPVPCDSSLCADHEGFDPQKGPMATQTLRGMLEPLHWRGDRATMNDFNMAFVTLMGTADIGPINGKPAGVTANDMETFRQFALAVSFPPNPYLQLDGSTPCPPRGDPSDPNCEVSVHGLLYPGNPTEGRLLFDDGPRDAGQPCDACHAFPFGTAGGQLGGVTPTEPTSLSAAALFFGAADASPHSDLKIPHLRNMYDKIGPVWAAPGSSTKPETQSTFGFIHDGSVPDLYRFLSINVFTLTADNQAQQVRDIASFLFHYDTGTPPATGVQVTLPAGAASDPPTADETLLDLLEGLGDVGDANRACELYATALAGGRTHAWYLSGGSWQPDSTGAPSLTTADLRLGAAGPLTFTCAPIGSGARLGGDRDEDAVLDGDDCNGADPLAWATPVTVDGLIVTRDPQTSLSWIDQSGTTGPGVAYDILGANLSALLSGGIGATGCVEPGVAGSSWDDTRPDPAGGDGYYYLIRATSSCGSGPLGAGREALDVLDCAP